MPLLGSGQFRQSTKNFYQWMNKRLPPTALMLKIKREEAVAIKKKDYFYLYTGVTQ